MTHHRLQTLSRARLRILPVLAIGLVSAWALTAPRSEAAPFNNRRPFQAPNKPIAPPPPASALLTEEDWQKAPMTPLQPGEIDGLVAKELHNSKLQPADLTTDEQFLRRATLDLTGQLPKPGDVDKFAAAQDSGKRARLIDQLLASDAYGRHWARYWRDVITARLPNLPGGQVLALSFEQWMQGQLKTNQSWDKIARAMITARGPLRFDQPGKNGAAFFLAAHRGKDAADERAAETSRVFLGIQIQCAQCHDHPSDQWKRVQFHELAGYFARLRERPVRDGKDKKKNMVVGIELISAPRGEHEMPTKEDPKKTLLTPPRFLDGKSPGNNLGDLQRREALARDIISKNNYWFASAYVNRVWGVLMGQAFYEPVDDLGPHKEAIFPSVLTRLTGAFRGSDYDVKRLVRDIMNSQTYQRQIRPSEPTEHLHFAAVYPSRLPTDALWQSLVNALGGFGQPMQAQRLKQLQANKAAQAKNPAQAKNLAQAKKRPFFPGGGFEALFKLEFSFDPSLKPDDIEGSITQVLLLMNSPVINQRLQARGPTVLAQILRNHPGDEDALRALYTRTLARKPTDRELKKCRDYIARAGERAEAFEDILWALLNSTEFQTKR
ncbi:MAG TPA: DUF1549 domain-containing protein [Gemmataceae bacterium]|jgi:hypothetical protein|nr:DUF1549 domain-containing protein [Gemmataceae bacterium]